MPSKTSPGCLAIAASLLLLLGMVGLWQAFVALAHHTVIWTVVRGNNRTWFDPWQAIALYGLVFGMGLYLLIDAIRKRKR